MKPFAQPFIYGILFLSAISISTTGKKNEITKRHDLYVQGQKAFENKNYVDAIKYLNTYKLINEEQLTTFKGLEKNLEEQIEICETQLRRKIVLIEENELSKKATIHGNGLKISPYIKDYIKNSKVDTTYVLHQTGNSSIILFGASGFETPKAYLEFLKTQKTVLNQHYNFIVRKNGKYTIDNEKVNEYLNDLNKFTKSNDELASLRNSLELQFHIQKIEVLNQVESKKNSNKE